MEQLLQRLVTDLPGGAQMIQLAALRAQRRQAEAAFQTLFEHRGFHVVTPIGAPAQVTDHPRTDFGQQLGIDILFGIRRQTLFHLLDRHNRHVSRCRARQTLLFPLLHIIARFNVT